MFQRGIRKHLRYCHSFMNIEQNKGLKHISLISVVMKGFLISHIKTEIVKVLMEDMEGID